MAKFSVGDLVDVRLDGEVVQGCTVLSLHQQHGEVMQVLTPTGGAEVIDGPDDCIPHVPSPVVPPAPVDPLTGPDAGGDHGARRG